MSNFGNALGPPPSNASVAPPPPPAPGIFAGLTATKNQYSDSQVATGWVQAILASILVLMRLAFALLTPNFCIYTIKSNA